MKHGKVSFIGAGPGDPELLTLKGRRLIENARLVLYAGSLVPQATVACASPNARVINSAPLTLEETHELIRETVFSGGDVARVHTGDPSIYGAVHEQIRLLEQDGIEYEIVPGVTAACAAAAAAKISFTLPEKRQSLVITRTEGRTCMPQKERLRDLAAHECALAIYLSTDRAEAMQEELEAALPPDTRVICAHRVGWPDENVYAATVADLAQTVRAHGDTGQTVFLVLPKECESAPPSQLYSSAFVHACRQAKT